ncbi:hypothetical protein CHS0354_032798 [Potamilus streckersoni]|uniref:Uncharacterized protein n=1 Tax=Potamilus streckersoni TaxID=2493646 RepID=A0AAE0VSK0_9BIVA|nr:hypothetical protein CHS0354_032798 [Potamilus streckersoni]
MEKTGLDVKRVEEETRPNYYNDEEATMKKNTPIVLRILESVRFSVKDSQESALHCTTNDKSYIDLT